MRADPGIRPRDLMSDHFDGGALLDGYPGVQAYWGRAKADPLGASAAATLGGIVPVLAARRAAASA